MVKDKWWKAALELKVGDILETSDGKDQVVKGITIEDKGYPVITYNLTVEDNHTFFVSNNKVLTHNTIDMLKKCNFAKDLTESATKRVSNSKLKFNNVGEYYSYITDIGKRTDINSEQKLALIQEAYESLGNAKGDVTCISDIKYLKAEGFGTNGRPIVDLPKFMGFDIDSIKGITRENPLPNKWDRIGAIGGENFTTLPSDGKIFSFDERAIPYLENFQARHIGNFNNDIYFDVIDAIKENDINKLNSIMNKNGIDSVSYIEFKRLNSVYNDFIDRVKVEIGNIDATYGLKGSAAPWKINGEIHMNGGAEQIVTPLTGDFLKRLGILNIEF